MEDKQKKLTFIEAAAIITGYGIGGDIMTVPYLTSKQPRTYVRGI